MKTTLAKKESVIHDWKIVDASGQILGRLAVQIANALRGRNKPTYTPHVDTGDYVIVVNADKVKLTGSKEEQKKYMVQPEFRINYHPHMAAGQPGAEGGSFLKKFW